MTCTKREEVPLNIPYWPMPITMVLCPLAKDDRKRRDRARRAEELRDVLETKSYDTIEQFLTDNRLDMKSYFDVTRASLIRPTIVFRRDMTQLWTNTFNPWIASILNSKMDLQKLLDEFSCATYVVEYVNKSNRGISHLHRELIVAER
jgi:hypothetical protein